MARRWAKWRDWPIFWKVMIGYVALVVFLVFLAGAFTYVFIRRYAVDTNLEELTGKAGVIAGVLGRDNAGKSGPRLREIESLSGATVILVDADMVAHALPSRPNAEPDESAALIQYQIIDALDKALVEQLLSGSAAYDVRRFEFLETELLFAGVPVTNAEGAITGAVILYRPLKDIGSAVRTITLTMLLAATLALLVALGLSTAMSRKLARPIMMMNATAKRMAEGHYGERVTLSRRDEVGQLAATLNLLSARLTEVIASLRDEKIKLEQILAGIGEGILAVDRDGKVVHRNNAALELMEMESWQSADERLGQLLGMLGRAAKTGERERAIWQPDSGRAIEAVASPVKTGEGEIIGAVGLMRDVSEAQRLEQLRRDYVANVSHELRTPLTGIRGMVEPLMDDYIDTEAEKKDCYRVIYQETLRLEKLIGEMLDMSRLQDGRLTIELEPLALPGVLGAAVRRFAQRAKEGEVRLYASAPEDTPIVLGEENRVLQVLIILADNALSFTPPGGEVELYARAEGERVCVGVRDTGAGIDPKDLPYIWERFYKADRSRLRTSGTGLGLSIAKLVCERMGGEIGVRSEPGRGATFEFTLQIAKEEP